MGEARRKTRNGAPSPQEEGERKRAAARVGFETRIAEAYAALEAMLEAEGENLRKTGMTVLRGRVRDKTPS